MIRPQAKILKLLFVADPLENFNPQNETTLILMREAAARGHKIFATMPTQLAATSQALIAETREISLKKGIRPDWFVVKSAQRNNLQDFDAVLLRKDPPFDLDYLHHLYLLEKIPSHIYCMNHARGILLANEKILPLEFPQFIPETLISADEAQLAEFIAQHPQGSILKPLGGSGGRGIYFLRNAKVENLRVILENATQNFSRHVILQEFLPAIQKGDKRILLLGSKILGAFARIPARGEYRANLHAGGHAIACPVTKRDRLIVETLSPRLQELGLDFVGLDVIGDKLIEINVTSPMGLAEIHQTGFLQKPETQVIDFIEEKLKVGRFSI